jgi:2',3'-cyclic-nucleotide 2'-phosphodiesterase (5'-nucleotidase family)
LARRATFIDGVWSENRPTLILDGGDLFGNRNKNEKHQTEFLAAMTGELGYDAIGLGERDLNYGLPFLREMIEKHDLPFTNANVRDGKTGELILPEYLVVERSGIKYGIVSVLDPNQRIITMTTDEPVFEVGDPVTVLKELLPRVRKEADNIILVGHLGETLTETVVKEIGNIDMVVVGHTHRNINSERVIDQTAVFGSAFEGRYIGRANLFVDDGTGLVMAIDVGITSLDDAVEDDEDMFNRVEQYKLDLVEFKNAKRAEYPRTFGSESETFLGERACMSCHKDAWESYVNSGHRRAFATIRNKGQSFEPECLSCHTTGYRYQNGYAEERPYNKLVNVQCEACHGYGTEHARDGKWAIQAKDSCLLCHDQKNSPDFDYATYWEKIKH